MLLQQPRESPGRGLGGEWAGNILATWGLKRDVNGWNRGASVESVH